MELPSDSEIVLLYLYPKEWKTRTQIVILHLHGHNSIIHNCLQVEMLKISPTDKEKQTHI